jgi:hypothetical protein
VLQKLFSVLRLATLITYKLLGGYVISLLNEYGYDCTDLDMYRYFHDKEDVYFLFD